MNSENIIHTEVRKIKAAKLISPSVERNKIPIGNALNLFFQKRANIFEVASGTGEHAVHLCGLRPDIYWQPSDPDSESRKSQDEWSHNYRNQISLSLNISTLEVNWADRLNVYDIVFCANMIHIAPWTATTGLIKGSYKILPRFGMLILYGPFLDGKNSAISNIEFDKRLKNQNSCWGVREVNDISNICNVSGFKLFKNINMPNNNKILIFKKL